MTSPAENLEASLQTRIGAVVFGVDEVIRGLCQALVVGGNVLLEGVPGLGKTLLAQSLANQLGGTFKRIQCTSDMMPSDITGLHVYDAEAKRFEFVPGPVFANTVLVDEINRTGPKTQSALLEAMEEGTVTIDRETYALPDGFFVIAAQNPYEFEGTYPLPESQLDRFLMRLVMGYPDAQTEASVLKTYDTDFEGRRRKGDDVESLPENLLSEARAQVAEVHVSDAVYDYVSNLAQASRQHPHVSLGVSTRGAIAMMRCARAEAAFRSAEFVVPDDIKLVANRVMAHRLILTPDAALEGISAEHIVAEMLSQVPVPKD